MADSHGLVVIGYQPMADLTLEHFNSHAMVMTRTYGVILPSGYIQHPHQRYPVIFLLHGGHGEANVGLFDTVALKLSIGVRGISSFGPRMQLPRVPAPSRRPGMSRWGG